MFRFLSSRRAQKPKTRRRIQFESLERRYCLTAPTISAIQIDSVDDTTVSLSGYATDESPETVRVDFYDALDGNAYPDTSGYFTYTGDANYLGYIVAVAFDQEYMQSNPAYVELTSDEPVIDSLGVAYGYHTEVSITGQVLDEDPDGLTVYFTGAFQGSAITDSNGDFVIQVADGIASLGEVTVTVSDAWGQTAYEYAMIEGDDPPEIVSLTTTVDNDGLLMVEGTVIDEDPDGLTVVITFLSNEYEVTTDSNGDFVWQLQREEGEEDWLTAIASDWWTVESEAAEDYVSFS